MTGTFADAQSVAPTQLPVGGQVTAGSAKIVQTHSVLAITQNTDRAAINWQSFDVGSQGKVNIAQPSSSSVLLNRIMGNSASQIFGQINANGQVILSNPAGMYFSPTAAVDVGSFTATTHGISDADFMAGAMKFTRQGTTGKIVNEGRISSAMSGYVALLAPEVRNSGLVMAKLGTAALASGEVFELEFDKQSRLANILVTPSTIAALVENRQAVHAPGGTIILSAHAAHQLQNGVVKNSGTVQATGVVNQGGVIRLSASHQIVNTGAILADAATNSTADGGTIILMANLNHADSSVEVGGTLSAKSGESGGNGGFVETSASTVTVQPGTRVVTLSPMGKTGTWLVDPTDFSIDSGAGAQSASSIGVDTLQNNLANTSVSISTNNTVGTNSGDLNVNASVNWSAGTTLSLSAYRNVNVNAAITATGANSGVNMTAKVGGISGSIVLGANVSTVGTQTFNGSVSLNASQVSVTSYGGGVSILGGVSPVSGTSNFTVASATDSNITGIISGSTKLIKDGNGTLALPSGNTYTGGTVLMGGKIRLDHANALGPAGQITFSCGGLQFTANSTVDYSSRFDTSSTQPFIFDTNGQTVTLANLPAGSGTLTKAGSGTLNITNAATRFSNSTVGATVINEGALTLKVTHPNAIVSQAVISGPGTLNIEPSSSTGFSSNITTSTHVLFNTGGGSLGSFNLGEIRNTADITLDTMVGVNVSGSQGYYGNNVTLASGAAASFTQWGTGGTLTLSGRDSVHILAPIRVSNANSSIAIKTSQNTSSGGNSGYYNFGLGSGGYSGRIDFSGDTGQRFTTQDGSNTSNLKTYTFISSLAALRASSASANLALLGDIDAQSFLLPGVTGQDNGRGVGNPYPYTTIREGVFTGTFAGLGHTISNLSVRSSGTSNAGLFSQLGVGGVVQDLRFEQANITGINMNSLGTVAGYANGASISGVMVANGSVNITSSGSWAGGLVGYTEGGTLRDVWVSNNPITAISSGAGGVMGRSLMTASNVHNLGSDVRSNGDQVGGLFGQRWNGYSLSRSDASGNVTGNNAVGGLVGYNWGNVTEAYNTGQVTGRSSQVGGLLGYTYGGTTLTNVSASGSVINTGNGSTGGMVGYAYHSVNLSNANYSGTSVTSSGNSEAVGGLVGYANDAVTISNASVSNAAARINISSTGATGGLVGWVRNGVTITDSFVSNANISGGTYVGGLVGEQRRGVVQINRSYAAGGGKTNVIGGSFVGGLVGEMIGGYITDSYYAGNITATSNYGGIVGFLKPGAYLSNTFYNLDTSLINGSPTLTSGGLYNAQFTDWVNSSLTAVPSRNLLIGNYFDIDTDGYYTISSSNSAGSRNDLSNVMGFSQGPSNGTANAYKFKLTSHVDVASSTTKFVPYFAAAEFKGNGFEVSNFSWSAPTSNVGYLGSVHKSTISGLKVYSTPYETSSNVTLAVNGQYYVGTAIGSMYGGVIYDSLAVLGGSTKGYDNTGGFMGYFSNGAIGNISATRATSVTDVSKAQVIGSMTYSVDGDQWQDLRGNTGGLAGYLGAVSANQLNSNLEVAGSGYRTGGLLGYLSVANYSHASVIANSASNLSASGNVTSNNQQTGGLIGRASGSANTSSNWTASGNVTGTDILGGVVGNLTSGSFSNLTSTMASVTSTTTGSTAGGLAGYSSGIVLSDSSAVANISATGNYSGGLIGNLDGANTLTNVSANGNVSTSSYYVGGLVGGLNGSSLIRNARYIGGSVTGNSYVGGLIGLANNSLSEFYGSYASTNITATGDFVGGLGGYLEGKLGDSSNASSSAYGSSNNHSYAVGNVTGRFDVGGLVGRLGSTAQVTNTYASVNVTANANFGGLIGHYSPGVEVTNSHYNMAGVTITAFTPQSPAARVVLNDSNGLLTIGGLYGPQYTAWFNAGALNGLASGGANDAASYFGAADANGYFRISSSQHVKDYLGFADQSALKFRLDSHLDLSSTPGLYVPYVAGELKGDGKTVSNLLLSQNTSNLGFIGHLRNNSTQAATGISLSNLTVNGAVTGVMNIGLVAGSDWQRNLSSVSSSGAATGTDLYYSDKLAPNMDDRGENHNGWSNVGGILGYGWGRDTGSANNLLFNNVSSAAHVTGVNVVGGMAGNLHYATVNTTTTTGTVTSLEKSNIAVYRTGGLVGQLIKTNSLLSNSNHAQGLVKGVAYVGGLVGEMQGYLGETVVNATPTYSTWVSSNVEGSSERVGGLVGHLSWGALTNAQMSGNVTGWTVSGVTGSAGTFTGGVGGYVSGSLSYLRAIGATIKGGHQSGGLVGSLTGTIDNSYATSNVSGTSSYIGGLVGNTANWLRNSYATGHVSGTDTVGGLAGYADWVSDSYATGNVLGTSTVGGMVGNLYQASSSYSTGNVTGTGSSVGGLVGNLRSNITNVWTSSNVTTSAGDAVGGFVGYLAGGTLNNVSASGYVTSSSGSYIGGFVGRNAGGVVNNATASGYVYGADSTTLNYVGGFVGWNQATITTSNVTITTPNPLSGVGVRATSRVGGFAGQNTGTITSSRSNTSVSARNDYVGGFVGFMTGGTISNSGAAGTVMGPYSVGGFAGYQNSGTIQASYANSVVAAGDALLSASTSKVGGFIGSFDNGTVTSSRAAGAVSGLGVVGGFVGAINNSASLNTSYATGAVTQTSTSTAGTAGGVGGFAGYLGTNFTGTVSDVYAMGAVTGTQNVGGLIGYADRGSITNGYATGMTTFNTAIPPASPSIGGVIGGFNTTLGRVSASNLYWNTETSNVSASGGLGTGLTTAQFKGTLSNTSGFNGSNTNWGTSAGMFPYLQIFYPTQPRAIEGIAYLSDGSVAKRAQVGQYTGGTLLNGGTASTGVNGYFYSVVGSNTLFADAAIPEGIDSVTVDPASRGSGYNNTPTVSFVGGGGSGATATASRVNPQNNLTTTSIYAINITSAGGGYTAAPRLILTSSDNNPVVPALNVTLKVPQFNTTQLATVLMLDGNVTVNSTVAGMAYTDRILSNDSNAYIYKDGNTNVIERVVQGITRLSTQNSSATLMNQDIAATLGATKQAAVAASLPTISSLELLARSSAFNLDTPLNYADNGISNAGNITVTGNPSVTLSGGSYISSKAQHYNAVLTLGADTTFNVTTLTSNTSLSGGGFNLTVGQGTSANSGNLLTSANFTGLNNFWVTGNTTLNGHVTSTGNQTYNAVLTLGQDTVLTGSNVTLASGSSLLGAGHRLEVVGNATVLGDVSQVSTATVSGTTRVAANVTTTGNQSYAGAMTLGGDSRLVASGVNAVITANGSVDGSSSGLQALVMNVSGTGGRVVLNGAVGAGTALNGLNVSAGAITMNAGTVRTSGDQNYSGAMTLSRDTTLSGTNAHSTIVMGGTVDSDSSARSLTLASGGSYSSVNFKASVGMTNPLLSLVNHAESTLLGDSTSHTPITVKTLNDMQFKKSVELQAPVQFWVSNTGSIAGEMTGIFGFSKEGAGTLTLSNSNSYSGNTAVNAGTVALLNPQALGAPQSPVQVGTGGVLEMQGMIVSDKPLKLQGGTLRASSGSSTWGGSVQVEADSQLDISGNQLNISGIVSSNSNGAGLLLSGQGAVSMSHPSNAVTRLASMSTVSALDIKNSTPLSIGPVTFNSTSYGKLQSTGAITLTSTNSITMPTGASVESTGGNIVIEASRFLNQAGAVALRVPSNKQWQIWSTNPTPFNADTGDRPGNLSSDYVHYNVSRASASTVPNGNGFLYSYAPVATAILTGSVSKAYDGTTAALLMPDNFTVTGAVNEDVLALKFSLAGSYVSAGTAPSLQGAGSQKTVQVNGLQLTAQQAGKPVYGYGFSSTARGPIGDIQPKPLDITFTKVYEGTNVFNASNTHVLTGMVGNEPAPQISAGRMTISSANAGIYNNYASSSLALSDSNYTLVGGKQVATIDKAPLGIAVNLQSKGKSDLNDIPAKDFTVIGLQNNETIPKIDLISLQYKDVTRNADNYVKSITVRPGPGVADMANYFLTQAVNRNLGTNTTNTVKLTMADELILVPAVARPYFPDLSRAESAPMPVAALRAEANSASPVNTGVTNFARPSTTTSFNAPGGAAVVPIAAASTPGIVVNTVNSPSTQLNGLVTVVVPKALSGTLTTGLVIGLPQSVIPAAPSASGETPELKVTLSNNQPLPDWIRFDSVQKALVTTPDARATFPISVTILVGDQRTVVVISESTQN